MRRAEDEAADVGRFERHHAGARQGPLSPGPSPPLRGRKGRIRSRFGRSVASHSPKRSVAFVSRHLSPALFAGERAGEGASVGRSSSPAANHCPLPHVLPPPARPHGGERRGRWTPQPGPERTPAGHHQRGRPRHHRPTSPKNCWGRLGVGQDLGGSNDFELRPTLAPSPALSPANSAGER